MPGTDVLARRSERGAAVGATTSQREDSLCDRCRRLDDPGNSLAKPPKSSATKL